MLKDRIREIVDEYYPENPRPTIHRRFDGAGKWELVWCESLESFLFVYTPRLVLNLADVQRVKGHFENMKMSDFELMFDKQDNDQYTLSYSLFVWYRHKPANFTPERLFQDVTTLLLGVEFLIIRRIIRSD